MDTKALRQKILDLAIRGKLVPQDPNDEPASVLLERIRAEKQQMVKDGKLKPKDIKNDTVIFKDDDNLHYEKFSGGTVKCIEDEIPFDVWQGMIPFSYVMESNETCEDMKCEFTHFIEQLSISLLGNGEIEVKAVLAFHSFFKKPVPVFNIEEITYEPIDIKEVEKRPGIIGYIVQDGDDLWELAKRYSTTMEGIMEVNQMENSDLKSGDKILIFKENMSIL